MASMYGNKILPANPLQLRPGRNLCNKQICLNRTRCALPFRIFAYTAESLPTRLRACFSPGFDLRLHLPPHLRELVTDDPSRACVFWVEPRIKGDRCPFRLLRELPFWDSSSNGVPGFGGLNHVIFETQDNTFDMQTRWRTLGRAALAVVPSSTERFVPGLDVAIPLDQKNHDLKWRAALSNTPPWGRKWLAAFKGSVSHASRARFAMHHDEAAGFIAIVISEGRECPTEIPKSKHNTSASRVAPSGTLEDRAAKAGISVFKADCCERARIAYESYNYQDVMNSTFGLILPGHAVATYRLTEVLSVGTIPVFIGAEGYALPYGHAPRWHEAALFVPADVDVHGTLMPRLRDIAADRARLIAMQKAALHIYNTWFDGEGTLPMHAGVVNILRRRFEFETDE